MYNITYAPLFNGRLGGLFRNRGGDMSFTTFQEIGKARRAAELSRTGIKLIVRDGVSYLFPDGHKMPIASTIDLKPETIAAWLAALYMIRKERGA